MLSEFVFGLLILFFVFGSLKPIALSQCPPGHYCTKRSIHRWIDDDDYMSPQLCPPGTSSAGGQTGCTSCVKGYYTTAFGAVVCNECKPGYMCDAADKEPVACPRGTYTSCIAQSCCEPCSYGTYTPWNASTHCVKCPPGTVCPAFKNSKCGGEILSPEHQLILSKFAEKEKARWALLYKATRDGFKGTDFHRFCDGYGQTMTIIQTTSGFVFGGYSDAAWSSSNSWITDSRAFLFTLINPHAIPPTMYPIRPGSPVYAINTAPTYGPTFGGGHDLMVASESNGTNSSYSNFPSSFQDLTGKGKLTFANNYNFQVREIEVYRIRV